MEMKKLKEMSATELKNLLAATREKVRDLKFRTSLGQLKEVRQIRVNKKTIAQILTLMKAATLVKASPPVARTK
ncbi:50S ribosomal protein L29 [Candidatus Uhrbacteria bacterium]|nr:50S ribosomal protein L29 [Candidatus Uhrbacteria bacterium]